MPWKAQTWVAVLALVAGSAAPAWGWSPATQTTIAKEAAKLAPPDLARQIRKHERDLAAGVRDPLRDQDGLRHMKNRDGRGSLDRVVHQEVEVAVQAIRAHRSFAEIVRQLGVVSHFVADANMPLNAADDDPREANYFGDYLRYVDSAVPRFPLVFYGFDAASSSDTGSVVRRALARGRRLYPALSREYARIGYRGGIAAFDDRSTAFGVSSLAFSHAVTDVAAVLRWIWITAGGGDERRSTQAEPDRVLVLPRAAPAP